MSKLVLIRHGESQWNLENRFTGWVDVPLSPKGIEEAKAAGKNWQGSPSIAPSPPSWPAPTKHSASFSKRSDERPFPLKKTRR